MCITLFSDGVEGIFCELLSLSNAGGVESWDSYKNLIFVTQPEVVKGRLQLQPPKLPSVSYFWFICSTIKVLISHTKHSSYLACNISDLHCQVGFIVLMRFDECTQYCEASRVHLHNTIIFRRWKIIAHGKTTYGKKLLRTRKNNHA